ncbi:MAG: hypothetical protein R2710_11230 [Acidimicrobiales bacterium]
MSRAADDLAGTIDWGQVPADLVRYDARGHGESTTTPSCPTTAGTHSPRISSS